MRLEAREARGLGDGAARSTNWQEDGTQRQAASSCPSPPQRWPGRVPGVLAALLLEADGWKTLAPAKRLRKEDHGGRQTPKHHVDSKLDPGQLNLLTGGQGGAGVLQREYRQLTTRPESGPWPRGPGELPPRALWQEAAKSGLPLGFSRPEEPGSPSGPRGPTSTQRRSGSPAPPREVRSVTLFRRSSPRAHQPPPRPIQKLSRQPPRCWVWSSGRGGQPA